MYLVGKSPPPPPPRLNTPIESPPATPIQLSPKSQSQSQPQYQASQTSPRGVRLSPPTSPTPAKPPPFQNKFHAKPTYPVTPSTPSDPVFTSPPPVLTFRSPSPTSILQTSKSSPLYYRASGTPKTGEKKTVVIAAPMSPVEIAAEQAAAAAAAAAEDELERKDSKRDLLQRANSSPNGLRPKRKDSGKSVSNPIRSSTFFLCFLLLPFSFLSLSFLGGVYLEIFDSVQTGKHSVVSPDDISHIRSLDPNAEPVGIFYYCFVLLDLWFIFSLFYLISLLIVFIQFSSPSSRLPKMPQLTPRESLKNSSVLVFSRKVSTIPPSWLSPSHKHIHPR